MLFRSEKKLCGEFSLDSTIGVDKDGNDMSLSDILADPNSDLENATNRKIAIEKIEKIEYPLDYDEDVDPDPISSLSPYLARKEKSKIETQIKKLEEKSNELNMEFATASLHNSFYFVEAKNIIKDRMMVAKEFEKLVNRLLESNSPKKWFRAYFNHGLINYIFGQKRLLPCDMSFDTFFIDPYGDVMPCNGTKDKEVMGNLNNQTWDELWNSEQAEKVRTKVRCCDRDCWMIGSVSPAMHKYIWKPALWVIKHKFLRFFKKEKYSMFENKIVRDFRDGKITKEELDKCSTCDMNCEINNGLSEASMEQLKNKSGEEIVDEDIKKQMEK